MRGPCHLAHPLAIDPHPRAHAQRAEFEDQILVLESGNPAGRSNHRRHHDWPAESFGASAKKWMGRGTGTSPQAEPTESGFSPTGGASLVRSIPHATPADPRWNFQRPLRGYARVATTAMTSAAISCAAARCGPHRSATRPPDTPPPRRGRDATPVASGLPSSAGAEPTGRARQWSSAAETPLEPRITSRAVGGASSVGAGGGAAARGPPPEARPR